MSNLSKMPAAQQKTLVGLGLLALASALLFRRQISVSVTRVTKGAVPLLPPELIGGSTPPPKTTPTPAPPKTTPPPGNPGTPPTKTQPVADSWVWPIASPVKSVSFLDVNYHSGAYGADLKGFWHTGNDFNVAGTSGNGDAGRPVRAAAAGRVEYVAYRTAGGTWGPLVVLSHRLPDGRTLYTRYAHLRNVGVSLGQFVTKGQQLAEIGVPSVWGAGFPSHLHFDVMHTRPPTLTHWPTRNGPTSEVTAYYRDPEPFLNSMKAGKTA